jgi:hypothetical protein
MFFLCTVSAADLAANYGNPMEPNPDSVDLKAIMIGQAPDCSSYLVLSEVEHEMLVKQTSVPEGYDFIFRQEWGLTINEDIIHRVIQTLRAESYPPMADYLDAKVKGDATQEANYLAACQAVKAKYPKFSF